MNDPVEEIDDDAELPEASVEHRARYAINERTGLEYVKARPGARRITSEEVRKLLEDFP